ncbi:hypothetical protein FSARC_5282 [Fusarium sarcochroum]|uniref:Uncharacterized protein n=1 Tax=Fusarium sarcochroum TaxID=1208366 RepID=A0A8H4TZT5_9HYPO|nr:hypothetical protein FSARC_5282 [Fusarium sarcochroum]
MTTELSPRSTLIVARLLRLYNGVSILAAYLGILSLLTALFGDFRCEEQPESISDSILWLTGGAITAVATVIITLMLKFVLDEPNLRLQRLDFALAWIPFVLVDWTSLELAFGLVKWHTSNSAGKPAVAFDTGALALLTLTLMVAAWVWHRIRLSVCHVHLDGVKAEGQNIGLCQVVSDRRSDTTSRNLCVDSG